jgi:CPA2 family monovalent cation:H+ antiporter-2
VRVLRRVRDVRVDRYRLMREFFRSSDALSLDSDDADRLQTVTLHEGTAALGQTLAELDITADKVVVTALLRAGKRTLSPRADTALQAYDVVVLFGAPPDLARVAARLLG